MKKFFFTLLAVASIALCANATDLTGKRIYVNPGHGSFGPNDRPMATIPYPALPTTGMPDTCGFYESNTNLWKCLYLRDKLQASGATVLMSRTQNGPWPYTMVNGDYPDYTTAAYKALPDYEAYNRSLSEICEEVEANNIDLFISVHSNAASEGTATNYPLYLYRGNDAASTPHELASKAIGQATWAYRFGMMASGIDPYSYYSLTNMNIRGDISFYGSSSTRTSAYSGQQYTGYLGVLKHGAPGGLWEGYFHTYQPARHRALNPDYCHMEGLDYYRGIISYYEADGETTGYIVGTVKDEKQKISNSLFNYAARTNDQWLPCNGALVTLYKAGVQVAQYQVDTLYNGIFVFENLVPGNDYTLDVSCPGYYPLSNEQKAAFTVEANKTTYSMLYLVDETWEPDPIVYEDYPTPVQPELTGLSSTYLFDAGRNSAIDSVLAGKVIRNEVIANADSMFVLAVDSSSAASYIYLVNISTGDIIQEVSTAGTEGEYYGVYSIGLTADGVLVGCNYGENQYDAAQVAAGRTRGSFNTYYWDMADLTAAPTLLFSSMLSGNFYNANVGSAFGVSGPLNSCTITTGAANINGVHQIRFLIFETENKVLVSSCRNQNGNDYSEVTQGSDWSIKKSPREDTQWIVDGSNTNQWEFAVNADAKAPLVKGTMTSHYQHADYFRYGGRQVMVAPRFEGDSLVGVAMFDITNGLNQARTIKNNISITPLAAGYATAKAFVKGADITIVLAADNNLYSFSTAGVSQPVVAHVDAYNLNMTAEGDSAYTFHYTSNTGSEAAEIVFYQFGEEVGAISAPAAVSGNNSVTIAIADIPGYTATETTWGVRLTGDPIGNWGIITEKSSSSMGMARVFNAINTFPETDHFGEIYLMNRAGSNSAASGLYIMDQQYNVQNTTGYKGEEPYYSSPYRMSIDAEGYVFIGDWGDSHSGVYVVDPDEPNVHNKFFIGSQNSSGLWTNAQGVAMGSSTPSVYVYGTGANTQLLVYNEDPGTSLPTNGLCVYNIGQADGSILHSWDSAPSQTMNFAGQLNTNGNVWGCSHGVWVSQHRSSGNNNASATSLRFYDWSGNCTFSSHTAPKDADGSLIIDGSMGSCFAITPDEKTVILNGTDANFMIFDIEWTGDTPVLTYRGSYKHNRQNADYSLLQMNWDYAGNLIVTGDIGLIAFTVPTDENVTTVPAKSSMTITKTFSGVVEGIRLLNEEATLIKGETLMLTAEVIPAPAAALANVVWSTSDSTVATVVDGVVTALRSGNATITAATADNQFSATCAITVINPVTGVELDQTAIDITLAETATLTATITPLDADNNAVVWSIADASIATVTNGVIQPLAIGVTTITVTTEDGGFTATCALTVRPVAVESIELDQHELSLQIGETAELNYVILPTNATYQDVVWSTSDAEVAVVEEGVITAMAEGTAYISVKTADGAADSCLVTVIRPVVHVESVSLDVVSATLDLRLQETLALNATILPADADDLSVTWASNNEAVATVAADGLSAVVTPVAVGTAEISVTTVDGEKVATCTLEVVMTNSIDNTESRMAVKIIENGHVYILRDGKRYSISGARVE